MGVLIEHDINTQTNVYKVFFKPLEPKLGYENAPADFWHVIAKSEESAWNWAQSFADGSDVVAVAIAAVADHCFINYTDYAEEKV